MVSDDNGSVGFMFGQNIIDGFSFVLVTIVVGGQNKVVMMSLRKRKERQRLDVHGRLNDH
jgi:hypothetical protein